MYSMLSTIPSVEVSLIICWFNDVCPIVCPVGVTLKYSISCVPAGLKLFYP